MKIILMSAVAVLLSTPAFSRDLPFKGGEKLHYNISYKCGFNTDIIALSLELEEKDNANFGNALCATCSIKTYKFFDAFYKMRETYESWFTNDADITPLEFHREAHNGKNYNAEADLIWNEDQSVKARIKRFGKPQIDTVLREDPVLRDMINCIYLARLLDFKAMEDGRRIKVMMTPYRDILELQVRLVGTEVKKIGKLGQYRTLKLGLTLKPKEVQGSDQSGFKVGTSDSGEYVGDEKVFLWVSDDENHVPLFFSSPASVGSITGVMTDCEGLKYPSDRNISED